ncbi:hypothetical protein MMC14_009575 [Varicellaria rhodocarpa]|nr:hypothetical protein [Varicellaria rhodocarpa]
MSHEALDQPVSVRGLTFPEPHFEKSIIKASGPLNGRVASWFISGQENGSDVKEYFYITKAVKELPNPGDSMKTIEHEYSRCLSHWRDFRGWKDIDWIQELKDAFQVALEESSSHSITQIICINIGQFGNIRRSRDLKHKSISYHRLIALEFYLDLLNLQQGPKIEAKDVFFQDKDLKWIDKQFLSSKGFTVLQDPDAYNKMTSGTFLYAPSSPWWDTFNAFMIAYPTLYMGQSCDDYHNCIKELPAPKHPKASSLCEWKLDDNWQNRGSMDLLRDIFHHSMTMLSTAMQPRISEPRIRYFDSNWSELEMPGYIQTNVGEIIDLSKTLYWKPDDGEVYRKLWIGSST